MEKNEIRKVAHDFNNIFTTIKNSVELLKHKLEDRDDLENLLANIENSTNRASDIIEQILDKGDKKEKEKKKKISIKYLLKDLQNALVQTLPKNIEIELSTPDKLNKICCVPNDIYRVLLNLCVNAKEAIDGPGKIEIKVSNLEITDKNAVEYFPLTNGDYLKVIVKDNGTGVPKEFISKIFDEGFSTKNRNIDSGIGLQIVKEVVDEHNGIINVKSTEGVGTSFVIVFPAVKKRTEIIPSENTILIGEDESTLLEVLSDLFSSYNYNVIEASDGQKVLDVVNSGEKIDLIVIDRKMPKLDGLSCINEIRKKDLELPIILASGSQSFLERFSKDELKIDALISKPYNFDRMLDVVEDLLS